MAQQRKPRRVVSIKPTKAINPEVVQMMQVRTEAHRRGNYVVLGAISTIETAAGVLRFPTSGSTPSGPTIGYVTDAEGKEDFQKFVVLTEWSGLPALIDKTDQFCPACLAPCHICDGKGEKVCEGLRCGGRGFVPGPEQPCPDCVAKTGKFDPACATCEGYGAIHPAVDCPMCNRTGKMKCSFCRGQGKYSTGIKGGQKDYMAGRCETCNGAQRIVTTTAQPLEPHVNALLPDPARGPIMAIGPIFSIVVDLTHEQFEKQGSAVLVFDISADAHGDQMFLLIDAHAAPNWPYLVGGLIHERTADARAALAPAAR